MIREKIKKAIEKENIPVRKLARELNIPYNSLFDWISGYKNTFPLKHLEKVCNRLNLELKPKR